MKKNYIAPNTEMATWASMGLMADPQIGFQTASGTPAASDNKEIID